MKNNRIVGRGHHRWPGDHHAEPQALNDAGEQAQGASLYVNLEPCCTFGRRPPCTTAIAESGIEHLVVGITDPNPRHSGRGIQWLREHGISVTTGVEQQKCRVLNEAFLCWITKGRPFVLLKMAMTLDGKIATADGQSKWITGDKSRRKVQRLRQWSDAVMVGAETVRLDDPSLTVRSPKKWPRQPAKLVWTRSGDIPSDSRIFASPENLPRFVSTDNNTEWRELLQNLGNQQITALLIEGGGKLAAAAFNAGIVDKTAFFMAPKILGGEHTRPAVAGADPASLAEAYKLERMDAQRSGEDLLITGYPSAYVHRTH